jgi:hypothetical protein
LLVGLTLTEVAPGANATGFAPSEIEIDVAPLTLQLSVVLCPEVIDELLAAKELIVGGSTAIQVAYLVVGNGDDDDV